MQNMKIVFVFAIRASDRNPHNFYISNPNRLNNIFVTHTDKDENDFRFSFKTTSIQCYKLEIFIFETFLFLCTDQNIQWNWNPFQ